MKCSNPAEGADNGAHSESSVKQHPDLSQIQLAKNDKIDSHTGLDASSKSGVASEEDGYTLRSSSRSSSGYTDTLCGTSNDSSTDDACISSEDIFAGVDVDSVDLDLWMLPDEGNISDSELFTNEPNTVLCFREVFADKGYSD
jgi:hypothetical protein